MMLMALMFTMLGTTVAMGQKIYQAELDKSMFKAWTSWEAGATEVAEPEAIDDGKATFNCENNLYKSLEGGNVVFGNTNVYYLWYADLTGTKTFYAEGTPGLQLRVLMNRPVPEEGGDAHGGKTVERMLVIGEDGKGSIDVSDLEFVHLNCIKVNWGGSGIVKAFYMEGTVKPVVGLMSLISNGNAEGTDLESFPVSYDGPNNGNTANERPEIVDGGVTGKCFKVTTFDNPTETWHTQFYVKSDEVLPKGTKWQLKMSIKADRSSMITTSAQGTPRQWKGSMLDDFGVTTEWQDFSWSGEIAVDDFQSIAFDLSNENGNPGNAGASFYFDNIEFSQDLGGSNPLNDMTVLAGSDFILIDFNGMTNMKELVKSALTETLIYDNSVATVTLNGEPSEIVSVEGFADGRLCIFLLEDEVNEGDVVTISFKNPEDAAHKLLFTSGKYEGEPVPEFSGIEATYDERLGFDEGFSYVSYLWGAPMVESITPEQGSFNLPADLKEFVVTFNQNVRVASVEAKLGTEALTASAEGEFAKTVKLTRTSDAALNGRKDLVISKAEGEKGAEYSLEEPIEVPYSFGPVSSEAQPEVLYASNFTSDGDNANGAGWKTTADRASSDDAQTLQDANSGSGNRLQHGQAGYAADVLYLAQRSAVAGIALYGLADDYKLELKGGVTYHLTLKSAQWDAYQDQPNRSLRAQILTEDAVDAETGDVLDENGILGEEFKVVEGRVKENKEYTAFDIAFTPEQSGNFVIRLVAGNLDGNPAGYGDGNAIADVKVEFIPDVLGIVETKNLNDALDAAKQTYEEISSEEFNNRYDGEALTALNNLINEVETNKVNYSAPSLYVAKTEELKAAAKAATDHKAACDAYDAAIKETVDLIAKFAENDKFNSTSYYKDLLTMAEKYHAKREEVDLSEDPEYPEIDVVYIFDVLKDDAALNTANTEVSAANLMASKMLTEGKSSKGWQQITTGYAALHERLRRGVELLKSLGLDETAPEIAAANAELGDNDDIADAIVSRATDIILSDLAKGEGTQLFAAVVDEETLEETTSSYDLSVFFKNPNIYGPAYSTETPGWTSVKGNCFAWSSWDGAQNHSASTPYPEDCDIHAGWHPNPYAMVEQTVENLPAGIYTIKIKCNDNGNSWEESGTCAFVRTSESPEIDPDAEIDRESDFAAYLVASGDVEDVVVADGKLSVGFYYGNTSQAFLEDIEVWMTAPVSGFNYAEAYKNFVTSIDAAPVAKVRGIALYDLNGRRIGEAQKGIQIVKKYMSDGTIRVEKVVKK